MVDMYTRVKRERRCVKRNMYGSAVNENDEKSTEESQDDHVEGKEDDEEDEETGKPNLLLRPLL